MSSLGPIAFGKNDEVFLGRDFVRMREFSEETAAAVDREVHKIIEDAYRDTRELLEKHKNILDALANALNEKETLESHEIDEIICSVGGEHVLPERWRKEKQKKIVEEVKPQETKPENITELPTPSQPPLPDLA